MFRHRGNRRTLVHNLKLASLLSFVAGIVNVTGFFSVQRLTTNVTGHFAYFADGLVQQHFSEARTYLLYILLFLFGAFFSNMLVEVVARKSMRYINVIPVGIETGILVFIAFLGYSRLQGRTDIIACCLLFAMGMQNALVTSISNAVVRTTHLTGLFTDLGIELSQLFFYKSHVETRKLQSSIKLRFVIICSFFLGCVIGGYCFFYFGMLTLLLAAACLLSGIFYDSLKYRVLILRRKYL